MTTAMPTHDERPQFLREYAALPRDQRIHFLAAIDKLVEDLKAGRPFRPGLRIKGVQGHPGVFEMTWSPNGRATFSYGTSLRPGDAHIVWRRIGDHDIFKNL
jgi:hypothetical protein